ncbi:hypothetical protein AYO37_00565 [Opitutia bacterium SCGC AG-212-L18]|nr:hypothetical protein AYO37_00565 [Opitutae bacterium SCGC AG-212-L18]
MLSNIITTTATIAQTNLPSTSSGPQASGTMSRVQFIYTYALTEPGLFNRTLDEEVSEIYQHFVLNIYSCLLQSPYSLNTWFCKIFWESEYAKDYCLYTYCEILLKKLQPSCRHYLDYDHIDLIDLFLRKVTLPQGLYIQFKDVIISLLKENRYIDYDSLKEADRIILIQTLGTLAMQQKDIQFYIECCKAIINNLYYPKVTSDVQIKILNTLLRINNPKTNILEVLKEILKTLPWTNGYLRFHIENIREKINIKESKEITTNPLVNCDPVSPVSNLLLKEIEDTTSKLEAIIEELLSINNNYNNYTKNSFLLHNLRTAAIAYANGSFVPPCTSYLNKALDCFKQLIWKNNFDLHRHTIVNTLYTISQTPDIDNKLKEICHENILECWKAEIANPWLLDGSAVSTMGYILKKGSPSTQTVLNYLELCTTNLTSNKGIISALAHDALIDICLFYEKHPELNSFVMELLKKAIYSIQI